jgi:predicted DNA-binding transcriptional regulator AlpA
MSGDDLDPLMTAKEVSDLCGVAVHTLNEWASKRDANVAPFYGPVHHQLSPRYRRWRKSDVVAWIESTRAAD